MNILAYVASFFAALFLSVWLWNTINGSLHKKSVSVMNDVHFALAIVLIIFAIRNF